MTAGKLWGVMLVVGLSACATPEFRSAMGECTQGAFVKYPVEEVQTVVNRSRLVEVPTGQTHCITTYNGNQANTLCHPVMRTEWVPYQEAVMVDKNKAVRESLINGCAQALCLQRYGNAECKTPGK